MKTELRNLFGRTGWAVVAAGALGIATAVEAQNYPNHPEDRAPQATEKVDAVPMGQAEPGPAPVTPSAGAATPVQQEMPKVEPPPIAPPPKKPARPVAYQTKWRRWEGAEPASPARKKPAKESPNPSSAPAGTPWLDTSPPPDRLLESITNPPPLPTPEPDSYITGGMMWLDLSPEPVAELPTAEPDSYVTGGRMWLDLPSEPPVTVPAPLIQAEQTAPAPEWRPAVAKPVPASPSQELHAAIVTPPAPVVAPTSGSTTPANPPTAAPAAPAAPSPARVVALSSASVTPANPPTAVAAVPSMPLPQPVIVTTTAPLIPVTPPTGAAPLPLAGDSLKNLKRSAPDPVAASSQQSGMSTKRVELTAPSSPKPPAAETISGFHDAIDPVMTKAQYAAVPAPKSDPEMLRANVMLDAPIKYGSPYMPVGRPKEGAPKPEPATGGAHVSSGIILIDAPATPPVSSAAPAKPTVPMKASLPPPATPSLASAAPAKLTVAMKESPPSPATPSVTSAAPAKPTIAMKESPPPPAPLDGGHVSSGIVLIDIPVKAAVPAAEPVKPVVATTQPAKLALPITESMNKWLPTMLAPKPPTVRVEPVKPAIAAVPPPQPALPVTEPVNKPLPAVQPPKPPTVPVEPVKPAVAPTTVSSPKKPVAGGAGSYVSGGVAILESKEKAIEKPPTVPVEPVKPAVAPTAVSSPKRPAAGSAGSSVSGSVVVLESKEKVTQTKAKPALLALQNRLQQRIAAICKKPAKDVEVIARSEKNLHIRVKAATTKEAEALSGKVLQLPELEPFEVSLDIAVGP